MNTCNCICHLKDSKNHHCQDCYKQHKSCMLCGTGRKLTNHHLIPKAIGSGSGGLVKLCRECHEIVHEVFSNQQLADSFNTAECLAESKVLRAGLRNYGIKIKV